MAVFRAIFLIVSAIYLTNEALGQSDLRTALAAIDRRQQELAADDDNCGHKSYQDAISLEYLNNPDIDYHDDELYDPLSKKLTSSFRERLEEDKERQMEEFAKNLYNNLESNGMPVGFDKNYLRELWDRYYGNDVNYPSPALRKRYFPPYGLETTGLKKRERYLNLDNEPVYSMHRHIPRDNPDFLRNYYLHRNYLPQNHSPHGSKRFMVTKRSSTYKQEHKSSVKKQIDPKVEKDLSNIFGEEQQKPNVEVNKLEGVAASTTQNPEKDVKNEGTLPPRKIEKKDRPKMDPPKDVDLTKEVFQPVAPQNKKQLQLKKKSIDWSDYFGLDRRKKSENNNGLDKEWMLERYHKAIAVSAKKRNAELPLQSFRNHQNPSKSDLHEKEEQKINEMDRQLEMLEDEIVEDTLKYVGAHEYNSDSKEKIQVKDNIISRLAQAYNVEKMRNALDEYRLEVDRARKEFEKTKNGDKGYSDINLEEKRASVPRKEAVDDTRDTADADNNIKCTTSSEDCHEPNYKIPADVLETHFNFECPVIERSCNELMSNIGHFGIVFEPACNIHQMCLLCASNSWFPPTRQCNMLFLTKAFELCLDKDECKNEARRTVTYLVDMNKSIQAQTAMIDECELQCPESGTVSK